MVSFTFSLHDPLTEYLPTEPRKSRASDDNCKVMSRPLLRSRFCTSSMRTFTMLLQTREYVSTRYLALHIA